MSTAAKLTSGNPELETELARRTALRWTQDNFETLEEYVLTLARLAAGAGEFNSRDPVIAEIKSAAREMAKLAQALDEFQAANDALDNNEEADDANDELFAARQDAEETCEDCLAGAQAHLKQAAGNLQSRI